MCRVMICMYVVHVQGSDVHVCGTCVQGSDVHVCGTCVQGNDVHVCGTCAG